MLRIIEGTQLYIFLLGNSDEMSSFLFLTVSLLMLCFYDNFFCDL